MTVPKPIPLSSVPVAGVFSSDLINYFMKCDATTTVDLATGTIFTGQNQAAPVTYFAAARLVLG